MVARITTMVFQGIDVLDVDVQVPMAGAGTGTFSVVGLPDKAVAESRERVMVNSSRTAHKPHQIC